MCGLAGISPFSNAAPPPLEEVRRMTSTLVHRGPDGEGIATFGSTVLGHRRLSIIDLPGGAQPMASPDGKVGLVFNGEIYNFHEIRMELTEKGHRFRTRSDTEVLLAAWLEWGAECVHRLRGMFAFAVRDERTRSTWLVRDRLGIKPLYYAVTGDALLYGSELKAILAAGRIERRVRPDALLDFLTLRYVPAPKTILTGIEKLPPGHLLEMKEGRIHVRRYWRLRFEPDRSVSEEEWKERIREKIDEAVRLRMIADVPLGAFLSGGVDSSLVVAYMARAAGGPVLTSSVGFTEKSHDELGWARFVADYFGTDHREFIATPKAAEAMEYLAWHYDEPFGDSSAVPTYYVSKMTRGRVKVALSGDGGDESFAGYRRYRFDLLEHRIRNLLPGGLRETVLGPLASVWPKGDFLPRPLRARTLLQNVASSPERAWFRSVGATAGLDKEALLAPSVRRTLAGYDPFERFSDLYRSAEAEDPLSRAQLTDFATWLPDDILVKVDRASMAVGLETRVPLLDHELVELAAKIPPELKLRKGNGKAILKSAMEGILPRPLLERKKQGFAMPVKGWLRTDLRRYAEDRLLSNGSVAGEWFDRAGVEGLWRAHQSGRKDYSDVLWLLLSFEVWSDTFLTREVEARVPVGGTGS